MICKCCTLFDILVNQNNILITNTQKYGTQRFDNLCQGLCLTYKLTINPESKHQYVADFL